METQVIRVDAQKPDVELLKPVAECIRGGGIVALPTETVYGLAVNLDRPEAVRRLLELRESPLDKKITVHIGSADAAERFAKIPPCGLGRRLVTKLWPGPLTLIFGDVGLRFPGHKACAEALRLADGRIGMPSANRAGQPPATSAVEALEMFRNRIEYVVDAGPSKFGQASTILRVDGRKLEFVREGATPRSEIDALGYYSVLFVCTGNTCRSPMAERLFQHHLARRLGTQGAPADSKGYRVGSAGLMGASGMKAADHAITILGEMGIGLADHRSRGLTIGTVQDADVVYALTSRHREAILEWLPECRDSVKLLDPSGEDIDDPVGSDLETYRACAKRIDACVQKRVAEVA